jgi:hypothetical protein
VPQVTPGRAVEIHDRAQLSLPEGHPDVPLAEPTSNGGRVGRAARRLDVDQLRQSLLAATGYTWVATRRVLDPDSPSGFTQLPDADILDALGATLGRPDFVTSTSESIDPAVTFAKLVNDAARVACRLSVAADVKGEGTRHILVHAGADDTVAAGGAKIRQNLSFLALRFWGRTIPPDATELAPLFRLFELASTAPAGKDAGGAARAAAAPADGWRAVCIAMATDPQFLTY